MDESEAIWKKSKVFHKDLSETIINERAHFRSDLKDRSYAHLDEQPQSVYRRQEEERKAHEDRVDILRKQLLEL